MPFCRGFLSSPKYNLPREREPPNPPTSPRSRRERRGITRGYKGVTGHVFAGARHDVIYLILGLQSVSSRLSTVSVDTSRSDQPPAGVGRHPDRPEHHHEHHHNHRHRHEHHHSVSPRPNQRHHPAAASTPVNANVVAADADVAASPQSNAQRRPVPRYVRILLPNFANQSLRSPAFVQ